MTRIVGIFTAPESKGSYLLMLSILVCTLMLAWSSRIVRASHDHVVWSVPGYNWAERWHEAYSPVYSTTYAFAHRQDWGWDPTADPNWMWFSRIEFVSGWDTPREAFWESFALIDSVDPSNNWYYTGLFCAPIEQQRLENIERWINSPQDVWPYSVQRTRVAWSDTACGYNPDIHQHEPMMWFVY